MVKLLLPRRNPHVMSGEWELFEIWSRDTKAQDATVIRDWERAVAEFVSMPHAAAVSSGRTGMMLILQHLGVTQGDEVIVPAYTLKDLIPLIRQLGASIIPADIHPQTLNVTGESVAARITPRTKAVIALHAFGAPAPMIDILEAAGPDIPVIEDAAHALGASLAGKMAGSFGYASFFSFETTKPVNTFGGGMVVSRDESLIRFIHEQEAQKPFGMETVLNRVKATRREGQLMRTGLAFPLLMLLANRGTQPLISAVYRRMQQLPPATVRYSPLQARIGLKKLEDLPRRIAHRRDMVALYQKLLPQKVYVQHLLDGAESTWYFCVAVLSHPAWNTRARMLLRGVDAGVGNEIADDCAALLKFSDCPNITQVFPRTLSLPLFDSCTETDVQRAVRALGR